MHYSSENVKQVRKALRRVSRWVKLRNMVIEFINARIEREKKLMRKIEQGEA